MHKKILILIILFTFLHISPISAEEQQNFILILVPDFSFQEIEYLIEKDKYFVQPGYLAAMNVRPDGTYSYINNMIPLSTGVKGIGIKEWNSYEHGDVLDGESVHVLQKRWTGSYAENGLIHPYFHKLQEKNNETTFKAPIGLLGELLRGHGIHRYVIGHSDQGETNRVRYGSLFTMDQNGESSGSLTCCVNENPYAPYGMEMSEGKLLEEIRDTTEQHSNSFIVIEWGDLYRLFGQKEQMTYPHFEQEYQKNVDKLVDFVENLVGKSIGDVMLLSPMMNEKAYKDNNRLAPLLYWRQGEASSSGILHSATTRQAGIVSSIDVAPTILETFGIAVPKEMSGNVVEIPLENDADHEAFLKQLNWIFTIFATRGVVLSSYITLLTVMLVSAMILLWIKDTKKMWITSGKVVLISAISSPFWFLVLTELLKYIGVGMYFWLLTVFSLLTGWICTRYVKDPIVCVSVVIFIMITIDLLLGTPFMQRSYLGYDPVIGARYYGIGNEYAGVYIMATLFVLLPFLNRGRVGKFVIALVLLFLILMLGAPTLGTNAGATIAAAIGIGYLVYYLMFKERTLFFRVMIFALIGIVSMVFLYFLQLMGKGTHIGYAFERLITGDFVYILDVIQRKLAMNWKIFKFSNWTQLFVTSYVLIGILLWKFRNRFSSGSSKIVLQTGIIVSVALLLLNDSGVVAAATSMFLIVSASLYWVLDKIAV